MLISLEGPDLSGKTTLFHALQVRLPDAVFVPTLPVTKELFSVMDDFETAVEFLWRRLYSRNTTYVVDRHMTVSSQVYAKFCNRPCRVSAAALKFWQHETLLFYLDCPVTVLERRFKARGDKLFSSFDYDKLRAIYSEVVRKYNYVRLDATRSVDELVTQVVEGL